jgi:ADP-ribosylglycohydrolase
MFRKWLVDSNPQPYGSYGNGSAMRVSFIGEYYETIDEVIQHARESAQVTHNHPQGIKGAIVTAITVFMAKHGSTKEEIFNYVNNFYSDEEVYKYPTWMSLDEMRKIYRWDETCQGSVPAAFRCIYEANSYEEFIRNVYSLPCDRDTLCAIGGSVAEELFGLGNINKDEILNQYLDDRCIDWINN